MSDDLRAVGGSGKVDIDEEQGGSEQQKFRRPSNAKAAEIAQRRASRQPVEPGAVVRE